MFKDTLKYGVLFGCTNAIAGVMFVSLDLFFQHFDQYKKDSDLMGYSLKNRFEATYLLNTPEEHKYYYEGLYYNDLAGEPQKKYYQSSEGNYFIIEFSAIGGVLCGLGFGAGGLIAKRKKLPNKIKNNSYSR